MQKQIQSSVQRNEAIEKKTKELLPLLWTSRTEWTDHKGYVENILERLMQR